MAKRRGVSIPLLILQVFAVAPVNLMLGFLVLWALQAVVARDSSETLLGYALFSVQGFGLGYAFQSFVPRAIRGGAGWTWMAPAALLTWITAFDAGAHGWNYVTPYFWPGREDADGLMLFLLTLPTVASCFYSFGVLAAHCKQRRRVPPADGAAD